MYLKPDYFAERGPHPADDIGQGYLSVTYPLDDLPAAVIDAARSEPGLLRDFAPDPDLLEAVAKENRPDTFSLYRNDEIAFDGQGDIGYKGFGLDIAFSDTTAIGLVAYTGPGLPTVVRRYECAAADEAVAMWQSEWAEPLVFTEAILPPGGDDTLH